jgi:hypothetical protein
VTIEEQKIAFQKNHQDKLDSLEKGDEPNRNWRKRRARWTKGNKLQTTPPSLKIEADSQLEPDEFWIVGQYVYGKNSSPHPIEIDDDNDSQLFPVAKETPSEYLINQLAKYEDKAGERWFEYRDPLQKKIKVLGHRRDTESHKEKSRKSLTPEFLKTLPQWQRDSWQERGRIEKASRTNAASDAESCKRHLASAIEQVEKHFDKNVPPEIMSALEGAYRAGRFATESDHDVTKKIAGNNFEMEDSRGKGRPTKKDKDISKIEKVIALCREKSPTSKADDIFSALVDQNLIEQNADKDEFRYKGDIKFVNLSSIKRRFKPRRVKK